MRDPITGAVMDDGGRGDANSLSRSSSRRSLGSRYAERYGIGAGNDTKASSRSSLSYANDARDSNTGSKWGRSNSYKSKKKDRWAREAEVLVKPALSSRTRPTTMVSKTALATTTAMLAQATAAVVFGIPSMIDMISEGSQPTQPICRYYRLGVLRSLLQITPHASSLARTLRSATGKPCRLFDSLKHIYNEGEVIEAFDTIVIDTKYTIGCL